MKKIIGGILIIVYLSLPTVAANSLDIRYLSVHLIQLQTKMLVQKLDNQNGVEIQTQEEQIQSLFDYLHAHTREITQLLKEKNRMIAKVQHAMDEKIQSKQRMTEKQMQAFQDFSSIIEIENSKIHKALLHIEALKGMKQIQKEFLAHETSYEQVYSQLNQILQYEKTAIASLQQIIKVAQTTVEIV